MEAATQDTLKFLITIFSLLNPIGALTIYITLTQNYTKKHIAESANSCSIAVAITILCSLVFGQKILEVFGISIASFTIAGGILIFYMAFKMVQGKQSSIKLNKSEITEQSSREMGVVPLAIPLLSGPGVISSCIIYSQKMHSVGHWVGALLTVIFISVFVRITLFYSQKIGSHMGPIGINVATRIMGIILLAVSIEMTLSGIKEVLPILRDLALNSR